VLRNIRITNFQYNNFIWAPQIYGTGCIYNAWTNIESEFPTPKQGIKFISIYACKHVFFKLQSPMFARPQPLRLLSVETLKKQERILLQLKMERYFTNTLFMLVKPLAITQGPFEGYNSA